MVCFSLPQTTLPILILGLATVKLLSLNHPLVSGSSASQASDEPPTPTPIENLAAVLTHRLGNLLGATEGYAALLAETLAHEEDRLIAQRILEGTARMEHLLSDLRLYAHPMTPSIQTLSLNDLTDILLATAGSAQHERFFIDIEGQAPYPFKADPQLLKQALLILTQNAFEATQTSGEVRLTVSFSPEMQRVQFALWNTGCIASTTTEHMFTPFFTTKVHNLGIGLTLTQRIAAAHDGTIALTHNTAADGTCLTLTLPYT